MKKEYLAFVVLVLIGVLNGVLTSRGDWESANFDRTIYAAAYGMKCDGVTDDTTALQNAINAGQGVRVQLPPGTCLISSSVTVGSGTTQTSNYIISGYGNSYCSLTGGTKLQWNGTSGTGPLFIVWTRDSSFTDFAICAGGSHTLTTAIQSNSSTSSVTTTNNYYARMTIDGTNGSIGKGFQFIDTCSGCLNANGDVNRFEFVTVAHFSTAAWSFEYQESLAHQFYSCTFLGLGAASSLYGVTTALGSGTQGGAFEWYGGSGGGVGIDFNLGATSTNIAISGWSSEGSAQLLKSAGSLTFWSVLLENVRWADNNWSSSTPNVIDWHQSGGLSIINSHIGDTCASGHALVISNGSTGFVNITNSLICASGTESATFASSTGGFKLQNVSGSGLNEAAYLADADDHNCGHRNWLRNRIADHGRSEQLPSCLRHDGSCVLHNYLASHQVGGGSMLGDAIYQRCGDANDHDK
jgi:Pectate lyase superfamily protein